MKHSKSYNLFLNQIQGIYEFSLMSSYAVPHLKKQMNNIGTGTEIRSIVKPDHYRFDTSKKDRIQEIMKNYKPHLSSYFMLSMFSFFEAYVKNLLDELYKFHGGEKNWLERIKRNISNSRKMVLLKNLIKKEGKLKEYFRKDKKGNYIQSIKELKKNGYYFPTDKFSFYGVSQAIKKTPKLEASELLSFLNKVFGINFTDNEKKDFEKARQTRNDIAHGRRKRLSLRQSRNLSIILTKLATKIDEFIVPDYFVIEYIPQ